MNRLSLNPENLHVESFPTEAAPRAVRALAEAVAAWPITRPECALTVYDTCDC